MEESKYLKLARQAREEDNAEDAKIYYNKVREEDPENGEAKFFAAYFAMQDGTNGELPRRFSNLCSSVVPAVRLIKNSQAKKAKQLKATELIVNAFVPETWAENKYMNKLNHKDKVGDSYVQVFSYTQIKNVCKAGMGTLRDLGDEIVKLYFKDAEATRIAVIAWKEYVSLSQTWYSYAVKGDAELYAAKIKEFDPSYVMPKKAFCISFGKKQ